MAKHTNNPETEAQWASTYASGIAREYSSPSCHAYHASTARMARAYLDLERDNRELRDDAESHRLAAEASEALRLEAERERDALREALIWFRDLGRDIESRQRARDALAPVTK